MRAGGGQVPPWSLATDALLRSLEATRAGLAADEAARRLQGHGADPLRGPPVESAPRLLLRQLSSPLVLILVFGALVALVLSDWIDAAIVLAIVAGSTLLGFTQEHRASRAMAALRERLALSARVVRAGAARPVPASSVVPGDIVVLSAGNLVPADGIVLEARDFLVVESSLTGESFPVEKRPGPVPAGTPLAARSNAVHMGTSVRSGTATMVVTAIGSDTEYGAIGARLGGVAEGGEFARGVRRFGYLLLRVIVAMVLFVLTVNLLLGRPPVDSLLFAVALAVGLSPELLPAIVSVTLSSGARRMAERGVVVRRLEAIENLGAIDLLCTDKTGTLTRGTVDLASAVDPEGRPSARVMRLAFLNAALETGIENPLDAALLAAGRAAGLSAEGVRKVDEIPYDFIRRRLTIVLASRDDPGAHCVVTKGAFVEVLDVCTTVAAGEGEVPLDAGLRARLEAWFRDQGMQGLRVLGVATRRIEARPGESTRAASTRAASTPAAPDADAVDADAPGADAPGADPGTPSAFGHADERGMRFEGFLLFDDPAKEGVAGVLRALAERGVRTKVISGDNRHVTAHLARSIGLDDTRMLTGEQVAALRDEALWHLAEQTDLFVEVDPQQKERIVRALQQRGHAVGYLGDGINDAPALLAADVGISVEGAVEVARESADIVLLRPDLDVLRTGIEEGRRTFANTLKYIGITTSANFGNMISMALAAPLLPFMPLLAKQILLNNLLSDLPSIAISTDAVDEAVERRAQRWNLDELRSFMIVFGLVSTMFDLLTFALLLGVMKADEPTFRTAWFVVSLLTELAVVHVLRTRGPFWASRASPLLAWTTAAVAVAALALPFLGPLAGAFGFVALSPPLVAVVLAVVACYVLATEVAKRRFHRAR